MCSTKPADQPIAGCCDASGACTCCLDGDCARAWRRWRRRRQRQGKEPATACRACNHLPGDCRAKCRTGRARRQGSTWRWPQRWSRSGCGAAQVCLALRGRCSLNVLHQPCRLLALMLANCDLLQCCSISQSLPPHLSKQRRAAAAGRVRAGHGGTTPGVIHLPLLGRPSHCHNWRRSGRPGLRARAGADVWAAVRGV